MSDIARRERILPHTIYSLFRHYNLSIPQRVQFGEADLIAFRESGLPSDLFCYRTGVPIYRLRQIARTANTMLRRHTYTARKNWWTEALEPIDFTRTDLITQLAEYDYPIHLVAEWYQRIYRGTHLFGFDGLFELPPTTLKTLEGSLELNGGGNPTYLLGHGRKVYPLTKEQALTLLVNQAVPKT